MRVSPPMTNADYARREAGGLDRPHEVYMGFTGALDAPVRRWILSSPEVQRVVRRACERARNESREVFVAITAHTQFNGNEPMSRLTLRCHPEGISVRHRNGFHPSKQELEVLTA